MLQRECCREEGCVLLTQFLQVLAGWVESVEDHGLLISFGVEGCKGFLRKAAAQEYSRGHLRGKGGKMCNHGDHD